jgi:uncharacterized RDD family membrane protein YckC
MTQKLKTHFRSRLIAFIIDVSIIYGVAFILYNLLQLLYIYVSTVRLSLIIAIIYFPALTILFRASLGKIVCGLMVENRSARHYSMAILLREVAYKQLLYILPVALWISIYKLYWLSPFFEIFCVLIISFVVFIFFLFRKKTWYDEWAKTVVVKNDHYERAHAKKSIIILTGIVLVIIGIRVIYYISDKTINSPFIPKHSKNVIAPYVSFLEKQKDAKDYIFNLFEKNDIVILCERAHPEMTQYDFIYDLISDKRFVKNVGNVFSEIGSRTQQTNLDSLMNSDSLSNVELEMKLGKILRDYSFYPIWANTNYFNYLKKLYFLNQQLPKELRIRHVFSDLECNWKEIKNRKDYFKIKSNMQQRDWLLAENVIKGYERLLISDQCRKKCLVIMNYRHAFGSAPDQKGDSLRGNCAAIIMKRYPDKVANVMLNQERLSFGLSNPGFPQFLIFGQMSPVKEGIWDNSFKAIGNKSLGFDFKNSPFGKDAFDLFTVPTWAKYKYQDFFTGFIFYKPLEEHYFSYGFKDIIANGFDKEIINRASIIDDESIDPDTNISYVNKKVKMLKKQDITLNKRPYQGMASILELLLGTTVLILGLVFGLSFFITKRNTR